MTPGPARSSSVPDPPIEGGMQPIEKKHLKRMVCPKCERPKLRFEASKDGVEPDGGTGPNRKIRCDVCKVSYLEQDAAIQAELEEVILSITPPPIVGPRPY
jgi:hypothetical protein